MASTAATRLAIDGGEPVRTQRLPSGPHGAAELGDEEIAALSEVIRRKGIFRFGVRDEESYVARLEAHFREFTGSSYALGVTGGTTALVAALVGLGVGTGDEVIVPGYTYIATAAAVLSVGAIPVIAEIDDTLTLDPADVEAKVTQYTRCIIPVHMRGFPSQMDELMAVARRHNLKVLEDTAQAAGGEYKGKKLGAIGDAGTFSFQQSKVMTSGEGGMVVTDDRDVFMRAAFKHDSALKFWGRAGDGIRPFAGENFRLCELRGAVAYVQFKKLAGTLHRTRAIKRRLAEELAGTPGIELARCADPGGELGITLAFYLPTVDEARRFSKALAAEGIANGTVYNQGVPDRHIYRHWDYVLNKWTSDRTGYPWARPYYQGDVQYSPDMCPRTLDYLGRVIKVNISQRWTDQDTDDVIRAIRKVAAAFYGRDRASA